MTSAFPFNCFINFCNSIFPLQPVSQNVKVDHHPAGGHWFAAGLSPNVRKFLCVYSAVLPVYLAAKTELGKAFYVGFRNEQKCDAEQQPTLPIHVICASR